MEKKEFNKSEIFTLVQAVSYADDAVVSKTVINRETGTITLFAFDKGQGLSEHTTPYDALVQVVEGKANIRIDGKDHVLTAGQIIVMPAKIPHALKAVEKFKMLLIMIRK